MRIRSTINHISVGILKLTSSFSSNSARWSSNMEQPGDLSLLLASVIAPAIAPPAVRHLLVIFLITFRDCSLQRHLDWLSGDATFLVECRPKLQRKISFGSLNLGLLNSREWSPRSWANLILSIPCQVSGFVAAVETCLVCTGTLVWDIGNGIGPCDIGGAFDDAGTSVSKVLFGTARIPGASIPGIESIPEAVANVQNPWLQIIPEGKGRSEWASYPKTHMWNLGSLGVVLSRDGIEGVPTRCFLCFVCFN